MNERDTIDLYEVGVGRHPLLCRWWLRRRMIPLEMGFGGYYPTKEIVELYVPWYAWPLELLHRAVFGPSKIVQ